MSSSSSAVVIGAGVAGASVAFALARRGVAVTVVDDGAAGQATAAGAGIVAPWLSSSTGRFYDLYAAGGAFYPRLLDLLGEAGVTPPDYRRTGSLAVHHDPGVLAAAEANVRERVAAAGAVAGRVERLHTGQLRDLFPPLAEDLSGFFLTGGGRVDGRTLRDALLAAATRAGARRMSGAVHLATVGEAVTAEVNTTPLEADAVVVTAGAWTADLLARAGVRVPVVPQRGQITHLRLEGADTSAWPTVTPLAHHYLVAFDAGRVVAGATRETGSGFDPRITAAGQLQVLQDALSIAPGLADATLIETRVGLRPLPDELPVVGQVGERLWVATGYGAGGLTMAPLLGDALARAVVGEDAQEISGLV
ncbi:NAD(P)/FAD-dependent oxidoreductase [Georgenia deserti]|uniref:NAD(P)/FAD-dependent oxidoreductase n=1 Tax=Georgenia deserti TaxID=2093781 RepID=A0ABW4L7P6_9MICO